MVSYLLARNLSTLVPVSRTLRIAPEFVFVRGFISRSEPKSPRLIVVFFVF